MENSQILQELNQIFIQIIEDDNIELSLEDTTDDVEGWDSLNHTLIIAAAQKHFNIKFTLTEVLQFQNVGDMIDGIQKKS